MAILKRLLSGLSKTREKFVRSLKGLLTGLMGGRVAEEIVFGDITSGASSDLHEATRIARLMVCSWGMSETLGPQTFGGNEELLFLGREVARTQNYSEQTARRIDDEVGKLLNDSYSRARDLLTQQRDKLETIASLLLDCETLDGRDVEEIVEHGRVLSTAERKEADAQNRPGEPDDGQEPDPAPPAA